MNIAAQIIGGFGILFSLLSFQFANRKYILLSQTTASLLFSLQLFMVGAVTGGCLDLISFVRSLIFLNNQKKWASSKLWLVGFVVVMIVTGIFTWENAWSILPVIGSILSTVALWMKDGKHIRMISLLVGPCWLVYNLINGAYTGAFNEILAMTSIVIGLIRCDCKKDTKGDEA